MSEEREHIDFLYATADEVARKNYPYTHERSNPWCSCDDCYRVETQRIAFAEGAVTAILDGWFD